ncbi:MAG: response regulator [Proteobacteria bacterium]|nr:response regulator [Pseudomonadota bacterium]
MIAPAKPDNEQQRLSSLHSLDILDTPADESFDRITRMVQRHFQVPIALVSLVDAGRQWFKSRQGLDATETPRNISFCGHAILGKDIFQVPNAIEDERFADNPLVTGPPNIRFYAGAPLATPDGMKLGTLCIIDTAPRSLSDHDLQMLRDCADCVEQDIARLTLIDSVADSNSEKARLSAVLNTVVDGIVTIDAIGIIETFNPAAERVFGRGAAEVIGQNVRMLMPAPYHQEHDGYLRNYIETNDAQVIGIGREVIGLRKDGSTFPMELAVSEMDVAGERMFTGIVRDITERKQAEIVKNEFISTVSHELRTPLTSIKGSLGLIQSGVIGETPDDVKAMLDIAYKNCDRLVRLINDILDIEKFEAGKMDVQLMPLDLGLLLQHAIDANKGYGEEQGVRFCLSAGIPDAKAMGDHDRLMQVLANLLSNAAKFSPEGTLVELSLTQHERYFRISVADQGPGIPEDFRDKIFGKFSQADSSDTRQLGGTGLGLNITKTIVEQHGGTIGFETEVGEGTTFYFDLPALRDHPVVQTTALTLKSMYHVLICEDDPDIAMLLDMMLKQDGFTSDIAKNAAEAERLLSNNTYDAMTLDLMLPDKHGITLLKELRDDPRFRDLPIVVISAKAIEGAKEFSGNAIGVIDWLEKPIDQLRLSVNLRRSLKFSSNSQTRILHVEDDPDILKIVNTVVGNLAETVPANSISEAKSLLAQQYFDLVILDMKLPDGDGAELLPLLKGGDHTSTPVIMFSAKEVSLQEVEGIKAVLVKSKTTNEILLETIHNLIKTRDASK